MDVIVTYEKNHTHIKDELKRLGYKDIIKGVRDCLITVQRISNYLIQHR